MAKYKNVKIEGYCIEQIDPVYSDNAEFIAVKLKISFNQLLNGEIVMYDGWLTCEGPGGVMALWAVDPGDAYEDLMHVLWNASLDRDEPGYETDAVGMFDQFFFPVDNVEQDDPRDNMARTVAEHELYLKAKQIYETLNWVMLFNNERA